MRAEEAQEVIVDIEEFGDDYPEIPKIMTTVIKDVEVEEMKQSIEWLKVNL